MKKSLLTVLLVLTLAVFLLPAAQAADSDFVIENGVLKKYTGPGGDVVIPEGVLAIGNGAFYGCTGLTSVVIPNHPLYGGVAIGTNVFSGCTSLTKVTILGENPRFTCSAGFFDEDGAFFNCPGLKTAGPIGGGYNIEFAWTRIPSHAFYWCKSLTSITIPDSVTSIEGRAFEDCTGLTSVTIPDGVTSVSSSAFRRCTNLKNIQVTDGNQSFTALDGVLFTKDRKTLVLYLEGKQGSYTVPEGVTSIGPEAFSSCMGLTGVIIPDSVTVIEQMAFWNCINLADITVPEGVTTIADSAFYACHSLTSVTIPNTVTTIGEGAFQDCSKLAEVVIPDSVTSVGANAFANTPWQKSLGDFAIVNGILLKYQGRSGNVTIPKNVTSIGDDAFRYSNLTSIAIPDSVTSIGKQAFYSTNLTSVMIPSKVTSIGDYAFAHCGSLTSVAIPDSVTAIGKNVFYNCPNLTVYGSASSEAARYCGENNIPFVETVDGFVIEAGTAIKYMGPGGDVMIPDGVVGIGVGVFAYRNNLTSVTIPESVTAIDRMAFDATFYLTAIHVAEGNPVYSSQDGVLFNKDKTELVAYSGGRYQQYVIPDSVTAIGEHAFEDCDLAGVVIPDSVTSIGDYAFFNCHELAILIPDSVTSIGVEAFLEHSNSTTVYGHEGCYAQQYCAENNISFEPIKRYPPSAGETRTITTDERWGVSITFDGLLREDTHVYLSTDGYEYYRGEQTFYVLREGSTVRIEALPGREYGGGDYYEAEEPGRYAWAPANFGMVWSDEDRCFLGYGSSDPVGLSGPITEIALPVKRRDGGLELIEHYKNKHYGMYLCESDFAHLVPALTEEMFTVDTAEEAYTGLAVTKRVTGQDGDKALVEGVDYTVTYQNNIDLGTATMTIAGIGGYTGTLEYTFDIVEVVHTGSMEGDGRSLDWSCSGTGQVTLKGEIKENEMVLVACYDEQGKLTELKRLTRDEMTARMKAGADRIKLFWLGEGQTPLSESATVWGK